MLRELSRQRQAFTKLSFGTAYAIEGLVEDSMAQGRAHGFKILQFNAVIASNNAARHLYKKLGFVQLGTIPGGFRMPDGTYADICPYYHEL